MNRPHDMSVVVVTDAFDDVDSRMFRYLEEASKLGPVHAVAWSDNLIQARLGKPPKFPLAERQYILGALRYVDRVTVTNALSGEGWPVGITATGTCVTRDDSDSSALRTFCDTTGLAFEVLDDDRLAGFPERDADPRTPNRPSVVVTGCYDWFHSGHIRFFEEVSALGDLHVVVGNDASVSHLKGPRNPMFPDRERRYMVQSIRYVAQAMVSSGVGWMDAVPEIERLQPDMYVVNEDGDRPEKAAFCREQGVEYVVLKREPRPGLDARTSTDLRGR
ncbi:MAG: adenylyltransferase/cytidyltransferase family protein [Verrucomicrobia bacterium]|nr:adenylyltransferase/cytidyltransferase family protein [Verrucomicrobiota bacterium]